jgi:hypothetical protein
MPIKNYDCPTCEGPIIKEGAIVCSIITANNRSCVIVCDHCDEKYDVGCKGSTVLSITPIKVKKVRD